MAENTLRNEKLAAIHDAIAEQEALSPGADILAYSLLRRADDLDSLIALAPVGAWGQLAKLCGDSMSEPRFGLAVPTVFQIANKAADIIPTCLHFHNTLMHSAFTHLQMRDVAKGVLAGTDQGEAAKRVADSNSAQGYIDRDIFARALGSAFAHTVKALPGSTAERLASTEAGVLAERLASMKSILGPNFEMAVDSIQAHFTPAAMLGEPMGLPEKLALSRLVARAQPEPEAKRPAA